MDESRNRLDLIQSYFAYCNILDQKGISYNPIDLGDLQKMPDHELKSVIRHVRDVARTPTT